MSNRIPFSIFHLSFFIRHLPKGIRKLKSGHFVETSLKMA